MEIYRNAAAVNGQTVTIRGKVEIISSFCALKARPPGNPCCNGCHHQLGFRVDGLHVIRLGGEDSGCSGNSCSSRCPPDNPCCNSCLYAQGFTVDAYHFQHTGKNTGCPGNDCRYDCPLLREGRSYQVDGVHTTISGYIFHLEVGE